MTTTILTGKGSKLNLDLTKPITGDLEVALQSLTTYYSWPNITGSNNVLKYAVGEETKTITIPEGCYDIKDIAKYIKIELKRQGDEDAFRLGGNLNTLKAVFDVMKDDCVINIGDSSLKTVLGWTSGNLREGTHSSDKKVNITNVNEILVHCNIIEGIYSTIDKTKLSRQTVLTSFSPNVAPGYKIVIEPNKLFYVPVHSTVINDIKLWLTDQDYNPIENDDEILTVKLHFRPLNK